MSQAETSDEDPLSRIYFLFSDYAATGEGRTVSVLITQVQPRNQDWERRPTFILGQGYVPGELKVKPELILLRQFAEAFDSWQARGMQILDAEEFRDRAGPFLPQAVLSTLDRDDYGAFFYQAQMHVNYS